MSRVFVIAAAFIAALLFLPVLSLGTEALIGQDEVFLSLFHTVLGDYVTNSLIVAGGAVALSLVFGVPLAWYNARYDYRGRHFFHWALILPLAMPPYIVAYIYTDWLDYAGPVQILLRDIFDWNSPRDYWFFEIRSAFGASFMLALVLYPYVYLISRTAFSQQSHSLFAASLSLGQSPRASFWKVSLPLARPAIVVGAALVGMESLADYGTVSLFAVSTLTTAVYDTWIGHGSLSAAAKLSCILLMGVFLLLGLEKLSRKQSQSFSRLQDTIALKPVTGGKGVAIAGFALTIFCLGFLFPMLQLLVYLYDYLDQAEFDLLWQHGMSSIHLALVVAFACLCMALLLNVQQRLKPGKLSTLSLRLTSLGYAVPGTVLAIGVMIPFSRADIWLNDVFTGLNWQGPGLLFSGTLFAISFAYAVRFVAIANGNIESGYARIHPNQDGAAQSLGLGQMAVFKRVHFPQLTHASWAALLLVFIESMKELPAALLLRPFNFETLATYVFQYASDEQLEIAAPGAIGIVLLGLFPLIFVNRKMMKHD